MTQNGRIIFVQCLGAFAVMLLALTALDPSHIGDSLSDRLAAYYIFAIGAGPAIVVFHYGVPEAFLQSGRARIAGWTGAIVLVLFGLTLAALQGEVPSYEPIMYYWALMAPSLVCLILWYYIVNRA